MGHLLRAVALGLKQVSIIATNINIELVQTIKFTVPSLVFRKFSNQCWHNSTVVDMVFGLPVLLE